MKPVKEKRNENLPATCEKGTVSALLQAVMLAPQAFVIMGDGRTAGRRMIIYTFGRKRLMIRSVCVGVIYVLVLLLCTLFSFVCLLTLPPAPPLSVGLHCLPFFLLIHRFLPCLFSCSPHL